MMGGLTVPDENQSSGRRVIHAEAHPSRIKTRTRKRRYFHEEANPHQRRGEAGGGGRMPSAHSAGRTVGDPADDRRQIGVQPRATAQWDRHHAAAHDRVGGELRQAVRRIGEGQRRCASMTTRARPKSQMSGAIAAQARSRSRRGRRWRAAMRDMRLRARLGRRASAGDRSDRHGRSQEPILPGPGMKDLDGHRRDENREIGARTRRSEKAISITAVRSGRRQT